MGLLDRILHGANRAGGAAIRRRLPRPTLGQRIRPRPERASRLMAASSGSSASSRTERTLSCSRSRSQGTASETPRALASERHEMERLRVGMPVLLRIDEQGSRRARLAGHVRALGHRGAGRPPSACCARRPRPASRTPHSTCACSAISRSGARLGRRSSRMKRRTALGMATENWDVDLRVGGRLCDHCLQRGDPVLRSMAGRARGRGSGSESIRRSRPSASVDWPAAANEAAEPAGCARRRTARRQRRRGGRGRRQAGVAAATRRSAGRQAGDRAVAEGVHEAGGGPRARAARRPRRTRPARRRRPRHRRPPPP